MCILFLAINQHHKYPLIICANRDEFYQRPTKSMDYWTLHPEVLGGIDVQAGGSWLSLNKNGHFAAVTNIRTGQKTDTDKKSRGDLVSQFVINNDIGFKWLLQHSDDYRPFNFVYGHLNKLFWYNSRTKQQISLDKGYYAISNGDHVDTWPKMATGVSYLKKTVNKQQIIKVSELLKILTNQDQADLSELPDTGVGEIWEKKLSSIFITEEGYGTRSSTILRMNQNKQIELTEVCYDSQGIESQRRDFDLAL